jgi:hypothetical protein
MAEYKYAPGIPSSEHVRSTPDLLQREGMWTWALTRHAVSFGRWEGGGVHVDDASWGEVVVLLGRKVEVPVFGVVWEESEAVELAVCCDESRV